MKFFEVFKAGKYPQGAFSQSDVEALANNYDPAFCEAPITLDHEQKGPAYGWVSGLKSDNGRLKASFRDVADELKDYVQAGKYKKISVEIYRELDGKKPYLKAVSFLGAAIPQVKGMDPVEFKEGESEVYIFEMETDNPPEPEIKENPELIRLQEQVSEIESQIKLFTDKSENKEIVVILQEKVQAMSEQISKMQDDSIERQKAELELSRLRLQMRRSEFEQFLNEQIAYGNLTPNQRDLSLKILMVLDSVPQFKQEDDSIEEFKQLLKSLPKQVEFDEIATKKKQNQTQEDVLDFANASDESLEIYKEAKTLSEKEKISFKDALLKLYK
ncbi:MAG: phage protease [Candidatus Gastranaerophilales bacterium]|nr:phage protease [Candidatus Gastranaerophilales bacterium]